MPDDGAYNSMTTLNIGGAFALVRRATVEQGWGSALCSLLMSISVSVHVCACLQVSDISAAFGALS